MSFPGSGRLGRIVELARGMLDPGGVILLYHRVDDLEEDPQRLSVSCKHFDEHLSVLRAYPCCRPLDLAGGPRREQGKPRVAVTFDDGYADNLRNAVPRLAAAGIPATIFVATGQIGRDSEWWWDDLERLTLLPATLPSELVLDTGDGKPFRFESLELNRAPTPAARGWSVEQADDPSDRHRLYRELIALLHPMPSERRDAALAALRAWSGQDDRGRASHRAMTEAELQEIARHEQIELAAHTVDHVRLASLPYDEQRRQLAASRQRIEDITGRPVQGFAYPYGYPGSYDEKTLTAVAEENFAYACANFATAVRAGSRRYELPRFLVRDWDGDEFARRLRAWTRR